MPLANLKVPAGTLDEQQTKHAVDTVTDLHVEFYGDQARANVMVLIDEVPDGGWGIGGQDLTKAMFDS